ncbi:hypothetical protein G9464_14875 [Halostella sp. JP-L12]|uniref:DUF6517 family protein n=1 Tax=Halostella TaxID=1843185 RepID=UPI000EF84A5B|nr:MULTISPECIES: DUF6517 family protein [Halostella]NHN48870.1 hypothetical protein [Halostella sp. JP-L12]
MTLSRRAFAAALSGTVVAGSGCLGFITGEEAQEFEASPATVNDAALEETDYQQSGDQESEEMEVTRTVEGGGQERDIKAVNYISQYERKISILGMEKRAAVFVAFTTPKVEILGKTFNPVGEMSNRELVQQVQGKYEGLSVGEEVDARETEMLGETVEISKFEGQADLDGTTVDVYVHVGQTDHDGDFVIPIGIYPQRIDDEEAVFTLLDGVEH